MTSRVFERDSILQTDADHNAAMSCASDMLLDAMHGRKVRFRPHRDPHTSGTWRPKAPDPLQVRRAAILTAQREEWEARRVSRDPCTFCGVRGDIGCGHRQ